MPIGSNIIAGASGQATGYDIDQSLRFNYSDSSFLTKTLASAGNQKTWTWSGWVKRADIDNQLWFVTTDYSDSNNFMYANFRGPHATESKNYTLQIHTKISGTDYYMLSSAKFRDASAWYHVVICADTTNSTATQRIRAYINGSEITDWATDERSGISQNTDLPLNRAGPIEVGSNGDNTGSDGYFAEVHFIDGQALTPASFGETNADTNQWVPIEVTGMTYGTNGFYLPFSGTQDADTKLLMHMDGSNGGTTFTDNSSVGATITAYGDAQTDTSVKKIGTASAKFDGTGDYVFIPSSSEYDFTGSSNGTIECWVRFNNSASSHEAIVSGGYGSSNARTWELSRTSSGKAQIRVFRNTSPWDKSAAGTTTLAADTWYHLAGVRQGDNIRIYVDGVQEGVTSGMNSYSGWNTGRDFYLGDEGPSTGNSLDGYIDELRFSSNTRYPDGTTFTPRTTEYGDVSIGADFSGNNNDFTPTNLVATDQVLDSPTNNFATLNPLDPAANHGTSTFKEGNLRIDLSGGNYKYSAVGNGAMSTGKWYFEFCPIDSDDSWMLGVADITKGLNRGYTGSSGEGLYIYRDGDKYSPTASSSYGVSWTYGDVMGVAVDMDNNAMYFAKNNTWMNSGDPTSGSSKTGAAYTTELSGKTWVAAMGRGGFSNTNSGTFNFGQDSSFAGLKTAQGNQDGNGIGDFYYSPPSGYLALCTDNLSDPSIADPTKHFNAVLWTGTAASKSLSLPFQPDWVWIKERGGTGGHNIFDSVRGANEAIYSNGTWAETYDANTLTSFDSGGFTVGSSSDVNQSGMSMVAWNWKAGGTASSNTDGSITSSVSANTDAGFSIVSYTGTGSNATVGHGLSTAPELVIVKSRTDSASWFVYSEPTGASNQLRLNSTDASTSSTRWQSTAPTSSVFSIGNDIISSGSNYIAYCFHSVDGYSKVGSYTGNGSTDGTFIYTGFRPAWILFKSTASAQSWRMVDSERSPYNTTDAYLKASGSDAESSGMNTDFVSNGVKLRTTSGGVNNSETYIYLAFAESPFKTANAR